MATLSDMREAIQANSGALPLIPKVINSLLLEYVRKFAPLREAFPRQTWLTDIYYFNQRNALPSAQFVQEVPPLTGAGSVTATVSNYLQNSFAIKHTQVNGDVSKFAQKVAKVNGSLLDLEIRAATMAMGWLEDIGHIYGNSQATINTKRPQWDGMDKQIGLANKIDAQQLATNGILSLPMLDSMIDTIRLPYAANLGGDNFFFMMSPKMQSKLIQLTLAESRVYLEKRAFKPMNDGGVPGNPVTISTVDPGVEVYSYRNIPIVLTSFLSAQPQMGTVSPSAAGSGSALTNVARFYQVSAVSIYGETLASAEVTVTPTSGQNVTLSWSTPTILDPFGNSLPILSYRVYESATTLKETLLAVVPAFDATDTAVTSFVDTGAASVGSSVFYQVGANGDGSTYPLQSISGNPSGLGQETIYLVSRDPELVVIPTVNDISAEILAPVNARSVQFALTSDMTLAMRAPLFAASLQRARYL